MIVLNGGKWLSDGNGMSYTDKNGAAYSSSINMNRTQTNCFVDDGGGNYGCVMNLGSGALPPTENDIWLNNALTSDDYECLSASGAAGQSNGQIVYTYTFRAKRAFTINEVCISSLNTKKIMMARTLIPQRVVEADEIFTYAYVLKLCGN